MRHHLRWPTMEPMPTALSPAVRDVLLRDGSTLRLRPPTPDDETALRVFFEHLSTRSRYLRFHGYTSDPHVETMIPTDWSASGTLVGSLGEDGEEGENGTVVAVATYVRLRDPRVAEVAFAVADRFQRRGIGTRLLEQLAERATAAGIDRFLAEVLPENQGMLRVFERVGLAQTRALDEGVVEVRLTLGETPAYLERIDERDHVGAAASVRPFFRPTSLAVVGASARRGSIGGELFRNVLAADFHGTAFPVNRSGEPVAGVRAYTTIEEIPDEVELAVLCVPGERVHAAAEEALRKGVRALCVISAGFAEVGPEGRERQEQLLALVRAHGARLVGPNCLGVASSRSGLNATFAPRAFPPGRIAFSSQSGALGLALLERAEDRGLGVSDFASIGNKADVSTNDLLEWWLDDAETDLVLLYLESFGNPRKFARITKRLARRKPVLAIKSGRSGAGRRAAGSHTAALAGSEAAVDALFGQAGVVRAQSLGELLDAAALLAAQPLPRGRRVAVLTNAGGLGILCADALEAAGLELPDLADETRRRLAESLPVEASVSNPVDMLGSARADAYAVAVPVLLADPSVDALIALFVPPVAVTAAEVGAAISEGVAAAGEADKPTLAVIVSGEGPPPTLRAAAEVPWFAYPEAAAVALAHAVRRTEWLRRPEGAVPDVAVDASAARAVVTEALAEVDEAWLPAAGVRRLLEAYGLPLVAERVCETPDDAAAAAADLGFPAVVKTAVAGAHKTETGGVALNLETADEVREAATRIGGSVLVQPMIRGGGELLVGAIQDPVFGPLVACGPGGVFAELIGDAQFRLAPLTDIDALELVSTGKTGRILRGFRGAPAADTTAVSDLLVRLGRLVSDVPEVAELDLNPVLALPERAVAVDARVRLARPHVAPRVKTW
jgi:acetyl coenzyme A synthetase (ADP forming)-like protein